MTEEEEDEELMSTANDEEKEVITHFDSSPWCKKIFLFVFNLI
jgi:hypothetical protein